VSDLTVAPPETGGPALVESPIRGLTPALPSSIAPRRLSRRLEEFVSLACLALVLLADLAQLRLGLDPEDEGYFAQQAARVLQGQLPFRDFDSLYTPALLYLHAIVVAVFGGSPLIDLRLVGWIARVLFAVALYVICRPMIRPSIAVLPAAYTLIALDRLPSTWEPHPGWPSTALLLVAVAATLRVSKRRRTLSLIGIGALAAVVFALKQNAGVLLGLALVVGTAWLDLDSSHRAVTRGMRAVQLGLLVILLAATTMLVRPHATWDLLLYFLTPLLLAGLAATFPATISSSGRTVTQWVRVLLCLGVGWTVVTVPWLLVLLAALDWKVELLKSFVGLVNQDPLWYPLIGPSGGAWASLVGITVALFAFVCARRFPGLRVAAALSVLAFCICLVELTRGSDDTLAVATLLAPGRASQGASLFLPAVCILGGVWLSRRTTSAREAWWLRWMCVASAVTFFIEYPRVDEVHLTWSAALPLATGAVVLPRAYASLVRRWQAGASRLLVALAFLVIPVSIASWNLGVRSAGFVDFDPTNGFPFRLAPTVTVDDVPAATGMVVPSVLEPTLLATARYVTASTSPGEPIFVYPTSPLLYVLADRPNPTRFDHLYPGAATSAQLNDLIATLGSTPVKMVVVSESDLEYWGAPLLNAPLETYLANNYHEVADFGPYRVLRRRNT
jgi:hypothetical protein